MANDEKADAVRAAAHWFAVLSADDVGEQEHLRWQRWLAADPSHHAAWQRVQALQQRFADLPGQVDRRIASHALRRAVEGRRRTLKTLAGLATLAGTGGAAAWLAAGTADWEPWAGDQRTGTGERRRFALADGTQAWLNTASAVALDDDSGRRGLRLMRGELLIAAGADARQPRRPLEVATAEGRVSASRAARFDVYRDAGCCRVTVFEGTVDVLPAATPLGASVSAGRQLVFDRAGVGAVGVAQALRAAWSTGVLLAEDMRLADLVAEFARYVPEHVACAPEVADLRVVGAFPLDEPARVYRALESALPVRVTRRWNLWTRISAR